MATNKVWFSLNEMEVLFDIPKNIILKKVGQGKIKTKLKKMKIGNGVDGDFFDITLYYYNDMTEVFWECKVFRTRLKKMLDMGTLVIRTDENNLKDIGKTDNSKERSDARRVAKERKEMEANEANKPIIEELPLDVLEQRLKRGEVDTEEAERILKIGKAQAVLLKNKQTEKELISRVVVEGNIKQIYSATWDRMDEMIDKWGIKYKFEGNIVKEMRKNFREALLRASQEIDKGI